MKSRHACVTPIRIAALLKPKIMRTNGPEVARETYERYASSVCLNLLGFAPLYLVNPYTRA
jgi:hypothetical protein